MEIEDEIDETEKHARDAAEAHDQIRMALGSVGLDYVGQEEDDITVDALVQAMKRQADKTSSHPPLMANNVEEFEARGVIMSIIEMIPEDDKALPPESWFRRWGFSHILALASEPTAAPQEPRHEARDQRLAQLHGQLWKLASEGECDEWELGGAECILGLVILLDRYSRIVNHGKPQMYDGDAAACALAAAAVDSNDDAELSYIQTLFLYHPLFESKDIAEQERARKLCTALAKRHPGKHGDLATLFARQAEINIAVLKKFKRFPHRNAVLGLKSSPEEEEFLKTGRL